MQEFQTATNMTVIWVFQWTQVQISFFFVVADSEKNVRQESLKCNGLFWDLHSTEARLVCSLSVNI